MGDDFQGQACLDGPTKQNCIAMLFEEDIGKNDPSLPDPKHIFSDGHLGETPGDVEVKP